MRPASVSLLYRQGLTRPRKNVCFCLSRSGQPKSLWPHCLCLLYLCCPSPYQSFPHLSSTFASHRPSAWRPHALIFLSLLQPYACPPSACSLPALPLSACLFSAFPRSDRHSLIFPLSACSLAVFPSLRQSSLWLPSLRLPSLWLPSVPAL